jgi:hypothetical protein
MIGALADSVHDAMAEPDFTALYLPFLMRTFQSLEDFDNYLFPLLECFASLTAAIGMELGTNDKNQLSIAPKVHGVGKSDVRFP